LMAARKSGQALYVLGGMAGSVILAMWPGAPATGSVPPHEVEVCH
jgi:hypothetical protein